MLELFLAGWLLCTGAINVVSMLGEPLPPFAYPIGWRELDSGNDGYADWWLCASDREFTDIEPTLEAGFRERGWRVLPGGEHSLDPGLLMLAVRDDAKRCIGYHDLNVDSSLTANRWALIDVQSDARSRADDFDTILYVSGGNCG